MTSVIQTLTFNLLPALALSLIGGIITGSTSQLLPNTFGALFILSALSVIFATLSRHNTIALFSALLLFFLTGVQLGNTSTSEPADLHHIYHLIDEDKDVVALGRLTEMVASDPETSKATIDLQSVRLGSDHDFVATSGKVLLHLKGIWTSEVRPGDLLAMRATFRLPKASRTPGTFDYARELARKDIWVTGYARSSSLIHKINEEKPYLVRLQYFFENLRTDIGAFFDNHLEKEEAGLYRAILLGDRSRISPATLETFRASGTLHILAISGLHLSVIGSILYVAFSWILCRSERIILYCNVRKIAGALTLLFLTFYTLLAGGNIPVVRACIMSSVLFLAFYGNRTKTISAAIAFGAIILLTFSPQSLFSASFQLSFAALIGILGVLPIVKKLVEKSEDASGKNIKYSYRVYKWFLAATLVSIGAVLGTLPIVLFHFHRFPLLGPLTNLVVEPLICLWSLPLGVISLLFIPILPTLATLILEIGGLGLVLATSFTEIISMISWASIWVPSPPGFIVLVYYVSLLFILHSWQTQALTFAKWVSTVLFLLSTLFLFPPFVSLFQSIEEKPSLYFLDVGQGSAAILLDEDGTVFVIDAGSSTFRKSNVGEKLTAPFLWKIGAHSIDTIFLTHPDADHTNGADFLLKHFAVKHLYTNRLNTSSRRFKELLNLSDKENVTSHVALPQTMIEASGIRIECLANTSISGISGRNDGLVIKAIQGGVSFLFPGDIEKESERLLVSQGIDLQSDILLAPHHGSTTSSSPEFLTAVAPQLVVISAGFSQAKKVIESPLFDFIKQQDISLLTTHESGTLRIVQTKEGVAVQTMRTEKKNPLRRRMKWQTIERIAVQESEVRPQ